MRTLLDNGGTGWLIALVVFLVCILALLAAAAGIGGLLDSATARFLAAGIAACALSRLL